MRSTVITATTSVPSARSVSTASKSSSGETLPSESRESTNTGSAPV